MLDTFGVEMSGGLSLEKAVKTHTETMITVMQRINPKLSKEEAERRYSDYAKVKGRRKRDEPQSS